GQQRRSRCRQWMLTEAENSEIRALKFGSFFSVSSHSYLIPPIQCYVGCAFADCVAVVCRTPLILLECLRLQRIVRDPRAGFCWLHFCLQGLSLVIELSVDKPKRTYRHLFSGPELAEGLKVVCRMPLISYGMFTYTIATLDAFVGVNPRDVSVPVVGGQSINGGGVTSDDIQDKGYKGNFDLRLRVAGRGTQLLEMINGHGLRRFVASYNPSYRTKDIVSGMLNWASYIFVKSENMLKKLESKEFLLSYHVGIFDLLHMEGSKVFVSAAAGSVGNFIGDFTSGDVLAFYVPWTNERPLENKELNAIIGARFTLWRD
ncbi:hypothetical protein Tco_0962659, partial [Tanacetum coccineum]